jgi:hypothetical protein
MTKTKWKTVSPCNGELSFSSPLDLQSSTIEVPANLTDQIKNISMSSNVDNGVFLLTVQCVEYHAGFEADIRRVSSTTDAELSKLGGTDIVYQSEAVELNGISGIKQEGSLTKDGTVMDFVNLIYHHDARLWQVMFAHEQHDLFGYAAGDNITRSIAINLTSNK